MPKGRTLDLAMPTSISLPLDTDLEPPSGVWTVWLDYFATGEGRTRAACLVQASSAEAARARFAENFSDYFARGADVQAGVIRNAITTFLFSDEALKDFEARQSVGRVELFARSHLNLS